MKKKILSLVAAAAAFGALAVGSNTVHADHTAGAAAVARLGGDRSCIQYDYGRATNKCSGSTRRLVTIAPTGSKSGWVNFWAAGSGGATCAAIEVGTTGWLTSWTGQQVVGSSSSNVGTFLGGLDINADNHYIYECLLPYNGSVFAVVTS